MFLLQLLCPQGCTASARLDAKNVLHLLTTSDLTAPSTSSQAHSSSMQHTLLLQARSPGQAARYDIHVLIR